MSKYDKASLVHIPSGYKSGTLYNVLPNDADGDFNFTRASTATRVNKDGLIETIATGTPRLDYPLLDGVVQDNPTLLLEPARTNLITYSEDFSQWGTVNGAVVTDNFTTSPDGTQNAAKVVYDGTSLGRIEINTGASGTNTQSIYLKTVSGTQAVSIGASASDLTEVTLTSEWQRFTHTGSGSYPRVLCNDAATIYAWGAQLEAGSYATSYIPTSGSSVTRSADVANGAGTADDFNDSEGVVYLNIKPIALDSTHKRITLSDGTSTNRIIMGIANNNQVLATVYDGANQAILGGSYSNMDDLQKVALKYKTNDFSLHYNGFKVATDTSGNTFAAGTLNQFRFEDGNGSLDFYGIVKEAITFNEALSDTELEALTSYDSFNSMATELLFTIE